MTTTTVRELKAWLEQFPEEAEVEFLEEHDMGCYQGAMSVAVSADLKDYGNWDYYDFTTNELIKHDHPYFGKKVLTLGAK